MKKDLDFIDDILTDTSDNSSEEQGAKISENITEATKDDWNDFWSND